MKKCGPLTRRKSLQMVHEMRIAGITFVPMPVMNYEDYKKQMENCMERLKQIEKESED